MNERYSRQILFHEIGRDGQKRLLASRVLIVGCGALGASHAEMLARAGVGKLRIVDRDFVEFTNLQRQTLFKESDAAERLPKAIAAKKRIAEINSEIDVEAIIADVNNSNVESLYRRLRSRPRRHRQFSGPLSAQRRLRKTRQDLDLRRGGVELRHDDDDHPGRDAVPALHL